MLLNFKALIVILMISLPTFALCKGLCIRYMSIDAFQRRRNLWLLLTITAFLSPNFAIYAIFAIFFLLHASRSDENPLALFVLTSFCIPDVRYDIPVPLIRQLFELTQYRVLALVILLPAAWQLVSKSKELRNVHLADVFLAMFLLLQLFSLAPYESVTSTMRRFFLFGIDAFLILYAFSRLTEYKKVVDVMACFWLACFLMSPLAIFESAKGWLLYVNLASQWGDPNGFAWLLRGDSLRSQVAAGHSINLGYQLSMGLGFYLFLREGQRSFVRDAVIAATMLAAIYLTQSRGAWVAAALTFLSFVTLRPLSAKYISKIVVIGMAALTSIYASPFKESFLDRLPFIGTSDQGTIEYRQQLAQVSWSLIRLNPYFGDPFFALHMESLRQGQGIIDLVNGYLFAALFTGFTGLFLLVAVFFIALARGAIAYLRVRQVNATEAMIGASLIASLAGTLAYIATAGYGITTYVICGLLSSYAAIVSRTGAGERASHRPLAQQIRDMSA